MNKLNYFWVILYMVVALASQALGNVIIMNKAEPELSEIIKEKILWDREALLKIQYSPGGVVDAYQTAVNLLYYTNHGVQIRGGCYSACTLFTKLSGHEKSCATPDAILYFHKPFTMDGFEKIPASDWYTKAFINLYPQDVQDWIEKEGGLPVDGWIQTPATKFFKECKI